jgi:hypothetical protein
VENFRKGLFPFRKIVLPDREIHMLSCAVSNLLYGAKIHIQTKKKVRRSEPFSVQ